jgi:hypothetical protein
MKRGSALWPLDAARGAALPTDLRLEESEPEPREQLQTSHSLDLTFSKRIDRVIFLSLRLIAKMPARLTAFQMARFGRLGHAAAPPFCGRRGLRDKREMLE